MFNRDRILSYDDAKTFRAASRSFAAFCSLVVPEFELAPHTKLVIEQIERLLQGKIKRLWISEPPRHGKSTLCSVALPAYYFGKDPRGNFISTSYSAELAENFGRKVRNIMQSEMYASIFPGSPLSPDSQAAYRFDLLKGGAYLATGRSGPITGRGSDILCFDDLLKNSEEAGSELICRSIIDWIQSTALTRLSRDGKIICIGTRWSESDPMGWLLRELKGWTVIELPATSVGRGDLLGRPFGAALWPSHFPESSLAEIRLMVGASAWQAMYMCNPVAASGGIFKRSWFRRYSTPPEKISRIIQSWDTAFKANTTSDFSVCSTWGQADSGYYLMHLWRGQVEFPELKRQFCSLAAQWKPHDILVEDKASGQSLIQELRGATPFPVKPVKVDTDKITRASATTGFFEAGKIFFPEGASWVRDLEDELAAFPNAVHDDQVDSVTQAVNFLRESGGVYGLLDWLKGVFITKEYQEPEGDFLAASANPRNDNLHAKAMLKATMEAQNATSNPFPRNAVTTPECPQCHSASNVSRIGKKQWWCGCCSIAIGEPEVMKKHNRFDLWNGTIRGR